MDIEKQTYLNTEQLQTLYERPTRAIACYGTLSRFGGVCFSLRSKTTVSLSVEFRSLSTSASISVDGLLVTTTRSPSSHFTLTLAKGSHVLDVDCLTHEGFTVLAEGAGLSEDRSYFDRVGGHSGENETVVYTSNGDRGVSAYRRTDSTNTLSRLTYCYYDDAMYYDKGIGEYTTTVRTASTTSARRVVTLAIGRSETYRVSGIRSIAMIDGRTLEAGADYLVATTSASGALQILRVSDQTAIDETELVTMPTQALRVVSAQRGSTFIVQEPDYVWKGYFFHADGAHSITFGTDVFHYDVIPLVRNRFTAPSATIHETDGTPIFYLKKENAELQRRTYEGSTVTIGYMENYHQGMAGGYMQYAGELQYETA